VVKGHSALLGTGEIAAQAIDAAIKATGMPADAVDPPLGAAGGLS